MRQRGETQRPSDQRRLFRRQNRIRGDCETTDDGVDLTMYLDGEQVGNVSDHAGFRPFKALGFFVLSSEVGTDVRFDNFEAQKP